MRTTIIALTAALALTACHKSANDAQADAVKADAKAQADTLRDQAKAVNSAAGDMKGAPAKAAENQADTMKAQADAVEHAGKEKAAAIKDGKATDMTAGNTTTTTTK